MFEFLKFKRLTVFPAWEARDPGGGRRAAGTRRQKRDSRKDAHISVPACFYILLLKWGFSNQHIWQSDKVISRFKFFKFGVKHLEGLSASLSSPKLPNFMYLSSFGKLHYRHSNSAGLSPFWFLRNRVPWPTSEEAAISQFPRRCGSCK